MIIADLNHCEIVVQEAKVVGGWKSRYSPVAKATAFADAAAIGFYTNTDSYAVTEAVAGVYSRSISGAYSKAVG